MIFTHISQKQQWLRSHQKRVEAMLEHFQTFRNVAGSGIKHESCCAVTLKGKEVYGNSQAFKLDFDAILVDGRHAEIVAYELGTDDNRNLVFCELSPCGNCQQRLANEDLEIVYMFDYATERDAWKDFHKQNLANQIADIRRAAGLET